VEAVFDEGPDAETEDPVGCQGRGGLQTDGGEVGAVGDAGEPDCGNNPPGCQAERFEEVSEKRC